MELRKIASFQIDHRKMGCGMYVSRSDGDIVTYDLRMKKPKAEAAKYLAAIEGWAEARLAYAPASAGSPSQNSSG